MDRSNLVSSLSLSLLLIGCASDHSDEDASDPIELGLVIEEPSEGMIVGSFADDEHALRFRSEVFEYGFEVEVELDGMTLTAQLDEQGNLTHDGHATANGEPTQMTDEDRAALAALTAELERLGSDVDPAVARLRSFASRWSEYPSSVELSGEVYLGFRSYYSWCWAKNTYQEVTHDDWSYANWADQTTYYAYISMDPAGPCSDGTWFWSGSSWSCYEPNHSTTVEYAYGNCFGRCGAGCGSDSQLTADCADHDSCVRFGHDVASLWCDDEFSSTADDWASAPDCY